MKPIQEAEQLIGAVKQESTVVLNLRDLGLTEVPNSICQRVNLQNWIKDLLGEFIAGLLSSGIAKRLGSGGPGV